MARWVGLLLLLLPAFAGRQVKPQRSAFVYFTQLGDAILGRSDAVLLGSVDSVTAMVGTDVVRVGIKSWYLGERAPRQEQVTLLAGHRDFFAGTEQLLFLQRLEESSRFKLLNRVARSDPDFDAKLRVLDQTLALRQIEKDEDRRRAVRKMVYDDADARDEWTRWHAFHELEWLRARHPDLVTKEDRDDLVRLAARSGDETFKKSLLKLLKEWSK